MNAKLLERLIVYRQEHDVDVAKVILSQKVAYQYTILNRKKEGSVFQNQMRNQNDIQSIMLVEARAARKYWSMYGEKIGRKIAWNGRSAQGKDCANQLLNIGYHYLTQYIVKICEDMDVPTELGFFHKAQSKYTHPFVYDFMEWLRPVIVDDVLLKIVSKKKKKIERVEDTLIKYVIFCIKKRLIQYMYHRELKYCIQLDYWIRLMLLEFIGAVNDKREYKPCFPSLRHESRCNKKPHKAV